jgi:hypothetical protein
MRQEPTDTGLLYVRANFKRKQCIYVRQGVRCERLAMPHNKAVCCDWHSEAYKCLTPTQKAAMKIEGRKNGAK